MSQTIRTYKDLSEERARLNNLMVVQRQRIKTDWEELKDEFTPVTKAFGVMEKFATADRSNPLINMGLKLAGDLFLQSFVLGKAGWAMKLAVPFVVKNYSSHILVEKGTALINKLGNLFRGKKKKTATPDDNGTHTQFKSNPDL